MYGQTIRFLLIMLLTQCILGLNSVMACSTRKYYVDKVIDLCGKELELKDNSVIIFSEQGKVINGKIKGSNTKIKEAHDDCMGVVLSGTWDVCDIYDTWFDGDYLSDDIISRNLHTIQADDIKQTLTIKRNHRISLTEKKNTGLFISSNTTVILDAIISIYGNNLERYNIVGIFNKENITLSGGELRGDVGQHSYVSRSTSEWGFALYIGNSKNITISNLKTSLCTGDGIYITGGEEKGVGKYENASKNITLRQCILYDLRREGISLVHADGVLIEDCMAINMGNTEYTAPSYGINIEPNKYKSVRNVRIKGFITKNTFAEYSFSSGGYQFDGEHSNRENIVLDNCQLDKGIAIMSGGVTVKNSKMKKVAIYTSNVPSGSAGTVLFDKCIIEGGNGIQFDGRRAMNTSSPIPAYKFNNCQITATNIYAPIPGLIWGTDLDKIKANMTFDRCSIKLQPNIEGNRIISDGFKINCSFQNCTIEAKGYNIRPKGVIFEKCRINGELVP